MEPVDTGSTAKAWLRALELTAPISRNRDRIISTVMEDLAEHSGDAPALLSDRESLTYSELVARQNQYARWALDRGVEKDDVVCLLMTNRPEYFAVWLGISSVGGVTALLNTNLAGPSLSHCINVVRPKHMIVAAEFIEALTTALPGLTAQPEIWIHGADHPVFPRIDPDIDQQSSEKLSSVERRQTAIEDRALCIFTSGTTGLPKAANVSHARILQWSYWFAGMLGAQPDDRMYNCLPMYHSIGGVLVPGATLVGGGSVVIREKFSASQFWGDILRWDCTMFQYIGELCRYLLLTTSPSDASGHRIRTACGNGMSVDVWNEFKDRFNIPRILEFYASTEGGVSLFNVEGKPGAIGRIPPYLVHRFSPALVRFNVDIGEPIRNEQGLCIRCASNEIGEALGKIVDDPSAIGSRYEGYTESAASNGKILRNVLVPGDAWIRTGDLMRKDEKGFYYFADRIGDTFRWKGENVAASEVSEAICAFPGVQHAQVYGVAIPSTEGRAGMAALVAKEDTDLAALRKHMIGRLPSYARPVFLRLRDDLEVTGTFKYSKTDLARQGYDPAATTDRIYFDDPESKTFVQLDRTLYDCIQGGQFRL
ncbi:MAG: long-chain-acyl-CoA synthetase [Silvibacterium sp.]